MYTLRDPWFIPARLLTEKSKIVEQQLIPATDRVRSPRAARRGRTQRHAWLWFLAGCALAVLGVELLLHGISGKYETRAGSEVRNFREGVATAHFLANGLRLTGNPQIGGAPSVLIVGDSHVEAFQVADTQTMGAALERRLRAEGKTWNALQYGWSGADGPDYVYSGPLLLEKFPTQHIFLIMNDGDFRSLAGEEARLVERDGVLVAEPLTPDMVPGRAPSYGGRLARKMKQSGLIYGAALRFQLDLKPQFAEHKASAQEGMVAAAPSSDDTIERIVRGLQQAYGDKLYILYTPSQPFSADAPMEPQERVLLKECEQKQMACRSLRGRMVNELVVNHNLVRGFPDSAPGGGHLNARGHEIVADELDDWLKGSH
jgi:hypothetical protein